MGAAGMVIKAVVYFWVACGYVIFVEPKITDACGKEPVNIEAVTVLA
jgi:hypothetical protein